MALNRDKNLEGAEALANLALQAELLRLDSYYEATNPYV
jgi:hypothetical protein